MLCSNWQNDSLKHPHSHHLLNGSIFLKAVPDCFMWQWCYIGQVEMRMVLVKRCWERKGGGGRERGESIEGGGGRERMQWRGELRGRGNEEGEGKGGI
jgi:hypothetical protein